MKTNLKDMIELLSQNDPQDIYQDMIEHDRDFREFINANKGRSTEEMIVCYNLNDRIRETLSRA